MHIQLQTSACKLAHRSILGKIRLILVQKIAQPKNMETPQQNYVKIAHQLAQSAPI